MVKVNKVKILELVKANETEVPTKGAVQGVAKKVVKIPEKKFLRNILFLLKIKYFLKIIYISR